MAEPAARALDRALVDHIGVAGAGAWGTALALVAARAGRRVTLLARRPEQAAALTGQRENRLHLPGVSLPEAIEIAASAEALAGVDALLLAVPAQHLRAAAEALAGALPTDCPLVICAKGIEQGSGLAMSEVLAAVLPGRPLAALSGPTFAAEVARDLPAAASLACPDRALGAALVEALGGPRFRPYRSDDLVGVELGGAVKNVIAIACGVTAGRRLGDNARAALITRGLAEIARLGQARGADPATFMGLSGLGDLTLTCTAGQSRNYSFGLALGQGLTVEEAQEQARGVVEGRSTAGAVAGLGRALGIEMPITAAVDAILNRGASIEAEIEALLARPFRGELA